MIQLGSQHSKLPTSQNTQTPPLYDVLQLEQKIVQSLRIAFCNWIRSLPMEERFLALKIYSAPIPQILRKCLSKLESSFSDRGLQMQGIKGHSPVRGQSSNEVKKAMRKLQKGFYDSLVLISDGNDYIDNICFEFGLLECPQRLFDLLVSSVQNPSAKLLLEALKNRQEIEDISKMLLQTTTLEQMAIITLNFLRQEMLLRFRESMLDPQFLSRNLQEEKRRKKQFSIHLKHLSEDLKKQMVFLGFKDLEHLKQYLMSKNIKVDTLQLEKEAQELLKLQKNQFCNRIFKCKLKKAMSDIVSYYEQIYIYWKRQVNKHKKWKGSKNTNTQKIEKQHNIKYEEKQQRLNHVKRHKKRHKKSISVQSNQTNVTQHEKRIEKCKEQNQNDSNFGCFSPKQEQKVKQHEISKDISEPPHIESVEKKKHNKKRKPKDEHHDIKQDKSDLKRITLVQSQLSPIKKKPIIKECELDEPELCEGLLNNTYVLKQMSLSVISQDLQDFADKISQQANFYHDRRIIAFQRIKFILSYYYIHIELFGSCASGIAIQNSDIDVAVKSDILKYFQYLPEHLRLLGALQNLQQIFSTQPYISEINLISTASIPIIKLKIDTSIMCLDEQYGEVYERLNRTHNSGIIEADITIQTLSLQSQSNHLGIISTQAINEWLRDIPTLHYIVITLKLLLQEKGFNKTYQGGLNTFSLVVFIVACIYHAKLQKQTNPAVVLEHVLKFYGHQFDQKQTGIDLLNYGVQSIFFSKKQRFSQEQPHEIRQKADLQILDPICNRKNITRNCYLFPCIKQFFREILEKCFDRSFKQFQQFLRMQQTQPGQQWFVDKRNKMREKGNFFELLLSK